MDLLALALQTQDDPAAAPVLADAVIEARWRDARVMCLCLGVPWAEEPSYTRYATREARTKWRAKLRESVAFADTQWDLYVGSGRRDFARAVLAVLLFAGWAPAKKSAPLGSRCPWPIVWRNTTATRREVRLQNKELRRQARAVLDLEMSRGVTYRATETSGDSK